MMLESNSTTTIQTVNVTSQPQQTTSTTAVTAITIQKQQKPTTTLSALNESRWLFPTDAIENTPSKRDGISAEQELNERQEAALFISDLGAQLKV